MKKNLYYLPARLKLVPEEGVSAFAQGFRRRSDSYGGQVGGSACGREPLYNR